MTTPKGALVKEGVETWVVDLVNDEHLLICQHIERYGTKAITLDKEAAEYVWRHLSEYLGKKIDSN